MNTAKDEFFDTETVWNQLEQKGEVTITDISQEDFNRLKNNISQYKASLSRRLKGHISPQILYSNWEDRAGTLFLREAKGTHKRRTRLYQGKLRQPGEQAK